MAPEASSAPSPEAEWTCIECGGPMERGFLPDATQGGNARPRWAEGEAQRSYWTGLKLKGRRQFYVETFRCEHCGALRSYALEPKA